MCAYPVGVNGGDVSGCVHDGEHGEGTRFKSAIEHKNLTNVLVFVAWVHGGVHLGEKRLRCIAQVAQKAIDTVFFKNPQNPGMHINYVCTDNLQHCSGPSNLAV